MVTTAASTSLLVGYFPARDIHGRNYHVSDIPASELTHVVYAFADISSEGVCQSVNPQDDQVNIPALQALARQMPGLKILISVGGAEHSGNYSNSIQTAAARQQLAQSCVAYMTTLSFDGIDIDWEFPAASDKENLTAFLQELRSQLDTQAATDHTQYLLTAAMPAGPEHYGNIQLDQVHQYLDWINLMAYNFYTGNSPRTDFSAPLRAAPGDPEPDPVKKASYNVDAAVKAYLSAGVPNAKIVVGVPFIGQGWLGVPEASNGLYQAAAGPAPGTWANDGVFDWKDLNSNYLGSYLRSWSAEASAPWLYRPDTGIMISYDDQTSLAAKAAYAIANGLGGVMAWPLSADDSQASLLTALHTALNPSPAAGTGAGLLPSSQADLLRYSGILPYDAELFGVYRPLLNWYGYQARHRVADASAQAAAAVIALMASDPKLTAADSPVADPLASVRLELPDVLQSSVGTQVADAASQVVNATGEAPSPDDWRRILSGENLSRMVANSPPVAVAGGAWPAIQGMSAPKGGSAPDSGRTELAVANFLTWAAEHSPALLNTLFLTASPSWRTAINFIEPFAGAPGGGVGKTPSAVLSPVGLVNLYREYFYELDTFLGPPVGHIWVSPGGSVELYEVSTRKTTVEQTTEASTTETAKNEQDLTQQDELSDSVKQDNKNDTKLGASASAGGSFLGIVHAEASTSYSSENAQQSASEEAHKHSRTQSAKLSKEITQNYKTTFRTVTETTDTVSRRYVLQNNTDALANYELRRKLQLIGVQLQHIGTRLCWQVYVPGRPGVSPSTLLGVAEFVPAPAESSASTLKPPDPLAPKEVPLKLNFPFVPKVDTITDLDETSSDRLNHDYHPDALGAYPLQSTIPDTGQFSFGSVFLDTEYVNYPGGSGQVFYQCRARYYYSATPPGPGYTLSSVRINDTTPDSVWATTVVDDPSGQFHIQLEWLNWQKKGSIQFDVTQVWMAPSSSDPNYLTYDPAMAEYTQQLAAAQKQDYVNATRALIKTASGITPRPADELRQEERHTVYRQLYEQLTHIPFANQWITAEYIRELFDIDEMLYFVEPDYYLPKSPPSPGPQLPSSTGASFDPGDPLADATVTSWPRRGTSPGRQDNDYLITEDSQPAPLGESLGWTVQLDGDERRNEFLNAAWIKVVLPIHPGRELDALSWLQHEYVEGETGLDNPYVPQPGDPPAYSHVPPYTIRQVLTMMASDLQAQNTDIQNILTTETVFERGFDPLADGIQVDPTQDYKGASAGPYQKFDFWLEVLPTDQVAAVNYDPAQHGA